MGHVIANAVVSLDGFVADEQDVVNHIFDWYGNGEVAVTLGDTSRVFHVSPPSAAYLDRLRETMAVSVIGRRLFDLTDGWGGVPSNGHHVVVVTHQPPTDWAPAPTAPYEFVDDVARALERALALADGADVSVTGGQIAGQALALGLVDEIHLNVAPVVLGRGRPFFAGYDGPELVLEDPEVIAGTGVVHMLYRVPGGRS